MAKKSKMKLPLNEVLGVVAGAVAAGFVTKLVNDKLPNLPGAVKSLIPIGAGVFLAGNKNVIVKGAGYGMVAKGGADLAANLLPGAVSGVDDIFLSAPADQSILSLPADQSVLSGDDEMNGDDDFISESDEMNGDDFMGAEEMQIMGIDED
jgi:hypothetical protein